MPTRYACIAALALPLLAAPVLAATAAQTCEGSKLKIAGKYDFCRLNAEAKAAKTGDAPDYAKCDEKLADKWSSAETKGAGMCPSNGDEATIQAFITQHTDDLAAALAGGPLPDCPADLATCSGSLSVCGGDLGVCSASLASATATLSGCTADLSTCGTDLGTCNASFTTCSGDLGTCTSSLAAVTGTAEAAGVRNGQTFSGAAGIGLVGTMPDNGAVAITPGTSAQAIAAGYHNGAGSVDGDADLLSGNIRDGVTVFGVTGTLRSGLPQTGQVTGYSPSFGHSDGEQQRGVARSFTDNGDGTITDHATGLMWEKKSSDGSVHDMGAGYTWSIADPWNMDGTIVTTFLATLNGGGGFAGHTDWRIPNVNELQSLANYEHFIDGARFPAFNTGCVPGCTVTTCSCSASIEYWSSTSNIATGDQAWTVGFAGFSTGFPKMLPFTPARAVRNAN